MNQHNKKILTQSYANLINARLPWNINIYKLVDRCDILVSERVLQDYVLMETIPAYTKLKFSHLEKLAAVKPKEWQLAPAISSEDKANDTPIEWRIAKSAEAFIKSQALETMLSYFHTLTDKPTVK